MKRLGNFNVNSPSSSPCVIVVLYDAADNLPKVAWSQESSNDVAQIFLGSTAVACASVIDQITINSDRPSSGGGLRRNTASITFQANRGTSAPLIDDPVGPSFYYGGRNFDDFYFSIYAVDRTKLGSDIKLGTHFGVFKLDNEVTWSEENGVQNISLIDIFLAQERICAAVDDEDVPDFFFFYNPWHTANFMPKAYGQVPRIRALNAFPSFSIKNFATSISGRVRAAYDDDDTEILLEENVDQSSLLLQAAELGGTVRVRMHDNEVIAGTLDYDDVAETITLNVTARNTYYNQVAAYNDSLDGRSPDQWGAHPNYTDTRFSPVQTVIPNAKDVILDPNGFLQADIWFYRESELAKGEEITDVVCQMQGLLDERKDIVIHSFWPDPDFPTLMAQGSISGYYTSTDNETYLPTDHNPLWPIAAFQFLKFRDEPQLVRLFFNDPTTSLPGEGDAGDSWQLVHIEPDDIDTSCYIRNGYSRFSTDHVFCEGEGKLIKIPPENVTITQSATFYGLTNMAKIALTAAPLDMNIGAKTNVVYIDCLYKEDDFDARTEKILYEIINQEAPHLTQFLGVNITGVDPPGYLEDSFLPYIGWVCKQHTTVTEIIDKLVYQAGITLRWDYGQCDIDITGRVYFNTEDYDYEVAEDVFIPVTQPLCESTDINEMLESSASLQIGKLKTSKYPLTEEDPTAQEYIALYFQATYGAWEDPFYSIVRTQTNRSVKPDQRVVVYHFDLINDAASFAFAVASALSSGHPSGYGLAQRRVSTDLVMTGCRWEALDPIVFNNFPGISDVSSTVSYNEDGELIWQRRSDEKPYLVAAHCNLESVKYNFDILKPKVSLQARVCQTFVQAGGVTVYKPPGVPELPNEPPTDPNSPPNTNGGYGGSWTTVGNVMLMPLIFSEVAAIEIASTDEYESEFTLTVDAGWIYDKGFSYRAYVVDAYAPGGESNYDDYGAGLEGDVTGFFPDKEDDTYIPPVFNLTLRVNYKWLYRESLGTTTRPLTIMVERKFQLSRNPSAPFDKDYYPKDVEITRRELPDVEGS